MTATKGVITRGQAVFLGVGAMIGAGIFALLGEAGAIALSAVWLSFLIAGGIAALQGYSFSYLAKQHASKAGLMGYISAGFGQESRVTSVFAWMVWVTVIIVVSMVAVSFGSYAAAVLTGGGMPATLTKAMASLVVLAVVALNALGGAGAVAKAQSLIVRLVIIVLSGLAVLMMWTANWALLAPSTYPSFGTIVGSIALTFFAFLGFGVISFTAKDLQNERDLGPATYMALALTTLVYVAIALGVFGQLTPEQVTAAGPTAIAAGGQADPGQRRVLDRVDHGHAVDGRGGERKCLRGAWTIGYAGGAAGVAAGGWREAGRLSAGTADHGLCDPRMCVDV